MANYYLINQYGRPIARITRQPKDWQPTRQQRLGLGAPSAFNRTFDLNHVSTPVNSRIYRISGSKATARQAELFDDVKTATWLENPNLPHGGFWYILPD